MRQGLSAAELAVKVFQTRSLVALAQMVEEEDTLIAIVCCLAVNTRIDGDGGVTPN